jgi:aminomethyltransferase
VFLNSFGHAVDDALLYPLAGDRFAVVVNAGMAPVVLDHLRSLPGAGRIILREPSARLGKLDIQGPASPAVLRKILADPDDAFSGLPYFAFKGDFDLSASRVRLSDGTPAVLSRSGYTGELGFELFIPGVGLETIWDRLLSLGEKSGILPCGLAARDSLRAGAMLPLSHQDIGPWPYINHPWHFALPLAGGGSFSFTKDFVGAAALRPEGNPHTLPFVGFDQRRVDPHEAKVLLDGGECGRVLTIVSDMAIGRAGGRIFSLASPDRPDGWTPRGLACGLVRVELPLAPGTTLVLKDARREIKVEIAAAIRPDRTASGRLT